MELLLKQRTTIVSVCRREVRTNVTRRHNEHKRLCEIGSAPKSYLIFLPSSVSTHFLSEAVTTAVGEAAEAIEDEFDLGPNRILLVKTQILAGSAKECRLPGFTTISRHLITNLAIAPLV